MLQTCASFHELKESTLYCIFRLEKTYPGQNLGIANDDNAIPAEEINSC